MGKGNKPTGGKKDKLSKKPKGSGKKLGSSKKPTGISIYGDSQTSM